MLEHPPLPTEEERNDAVSLALKPEIQAVNANYPYWDRVKYIKTQEGISNKSLWFALKFIRQINRTDVHFGKYRFSFTMTDEMFELLHYFDMNIGGNLAGEYLIPAENKNTYLISSIMEEAIASSQMEGAATTRREAKEMLRKSSKPKNKGQQMILNNYFTINYIKGIAKNAFSTHELINIHKSMTSNTLDYEEDAGKIRTNDNIYVINGITGDVTHTPPHFEELNDMLDDLVEFFNKDNESFIHPIIKGIIIHFILAFMHPFADGNGRTARSIFYWYMLKNDYWLIEYLSISRIIYKTKIMYEKSFLFTEYDDNDLTYFILYNLRTMKKAFEELKLYLKRKTEEFNSVQLLSNITGINHRQAQIINIFLERPTSFLSVKEIENRFTVSNFTARADLEGLVELGFLSEVKLNKIKRNYIKSERFDELVRRKM